MAGGEDYIPIRTALVDDPDVLALARLLGKDRDLVVGKLVRFWSFAARVTPDGRLGPYTAKEIDDVVVCRGFAKALQTFRENHQDPERRQGWLVQDPATGELSIPKWDEWMSKSAKARAGEAVRKKIQRTCPDKCPDKRPDQRREEKRREEKTPSSTSTVGSARAESAATTATTAAVVSVGVGERTVTPGGRTHWGPTVEQKPRYEALIIAGVSPTKAMEFVSQPFPTLEAIRRVHDSRTQRGLPADHGLIGQLKTAAAKESIMAERRRAMEEQTR